MKKYIVLLILVILFGFTFAFRRPLYNLYRTYFVKEEKEVTLTASNDYTRDYDFNYVKRTDDFTPSNYQDLLNIYYTVLNSGEEEFSFYCTDEYSECINDVDSLANNQKVNSLDAMSGQPDYQAKKFQNVPNKGPIPEGTYYANQNQRQTIGILDAAIGAGTGILGINRGKWKGSLPAWGMRRIWLKPDSDTNTYGRDGFTIHGGFSKGSAGCIDIPWQTGILSDYMDNCQESVPVYVGYSKDNW